MTCPRHAPGQTFAEHQMAVAEWAGYASVADLNRDHDPLHAALCGWLGIPSHSLACARGEPFDERLAGIEEDAVLATQRLIAHHQTGVPT